MLCHKKAKVAGTERTPSGPTQIFISACRWLLSAAMYSLQCDNKIDKSPCQDLNMNDFNTEDG